MQAFSVPDIDTKNFMQHIFTHDTFINFEVRGVMVHSFTRFEISGEKDGETYCNWEELRPYVRNIVKGNEKPRAMKFIFARGNPETLHPNAAALFLNINYDGDKINITTACSQKNFELNKNVDTEWDTWVENFFNHIGIKLEK